MSRLPYFNISFLVFCSLVCVLLFSCIKPSPVSTVAKPNALLKTKTLYKTLSSTQAIGKYEYEYDAQGRLTKLIDNGTDSPSTFGYTTFTYNVDGTIAKKDSFISDSQQSTGYRLVRTYNYNYQSGLLASITAGGSLFELFDYTGNKLTTLSIFDAQGVSITDNVTFDYDSKGILIKRSHLQPVVGLIDYTLYQYSNGALTAEALNTNGVDSSITFQYTNNVVTKISYFNRFKELVELRQFSLDENRNVIIEIKSDYPRGWPDNSYVAKYEYYP